MFEQTSQLRERNVKSWGFGQTILYLVFTGYISIVSVLFVYIWVYCRDIITANIVVCLRVLYGFCSNNLLGRIFMSWFFCSPVDFCPRTCVTWCVWGFSLVSQFGLLIIFLIGWITSRLVRHVTLVCLYYMIVTSITSCDLFFVYWMKMKYRLLFEL